MSTLNTNGETPNFNSEFDWQRHPLADQLIRALVEQACSNIPAASNLNQRMLKETGTRFVDWVDHVAVAPQTLVNDIEIESALSTAGFELTAQTADEKCFRHHGGLFVPVYVCNEFKDGPIRSRVAIKIDSVADFAAIHPMAGSVMGEESSQFRKAMVADSAGHQFWVCERHGWTQWSLCQSPQPQIKLAIDVYAGFLKRPRKGFAGARAIIQDSVNRIGVDWACDLFFAAEREFWQSRNHAARVQRKRQDSLGLGWGNHDHHTYRSSRESFADMIECFEILEFYCRERFYAGQQAGWGAQVLEQTNTGVVIFADVDLSAEELAGDFAHQGLAAQSELGTVGLWCQLHGEAFLAAGMHHLECQFDFSDARKQLANEGVKSMDPFSDFEYLRQSFTQGEIWEVDPVRLNSAQAKGFITAEQAEKFRTEGAVGSHLEILERNDGFKGFNQTGVSEIILKTDPRKIKI